MLINPNLFYSTPAWVIWTPQLQLFFAYWRLARVYYQAICLICAPSHISNTLDMSTWISHRTTKSTSPKQFLSFSPKLVLLDVLPWWLGPLSTQSSPTPGSHPWPLLLSLLMTKSSCFSLLNAFHTYSFLLISWPLPLFWGKNLLTCSSVWKYSLEVV